MGVLHYGRGEGCVAEPTAPEAPQVALFLDHAHHIPKLTGS